MSAPDLSVILPTYNEMRRLPQTMSEILPYLERHIPNYEVIVVDDNSPDGTAEYVRTTFSNNPKVRVISQAGRIGKGAAVKRGCLEAKGELVLFMDADHATPISELDDILPLFRDNSVRVVAGVRTYQENESKWRRIVGLLAQLLAHLIVFQRAVIDSQCGFKIFRRSVVEQVFPKLQVEGGMLDVEIFFLLHRYNIPCRYQPVHWDNKEFSQINVWRCMVFDPIDMVRIRARALLGAYDQAGRDTATESHRNDSSRPAEA